MNFSCVLVLAFALFGAFANAYIGTGYGGLGYNTLGGIGGGAIRTTGPPSVCDTCQCVKTIVRPVVDHIPYSCSRRVHNAGYGTGMLGGATGVYGGGAVGTGVVGTGLLGARGGLLGGYGSGYGGNVIV